MYDVKMKYFKIFHSWFWTSFVWWTFPRDKVLNRRLSDKTYEKRQNDSEKKRHRLKEGQGVKGDLSKYSTDDFE